MRPLVSIVVPSYKTVAYIKETMDSILGQTYENLEVIVSDHSSPDGTWELLQPYAQDPRVQLFEQPRGGGAPANWTAVTERATGEFLKLVCGDDTIDPTCVERQVDVMLAAPNAVVCASKRRIVNSHGEVLMASRGLGHLRGEVSGPQAVRAAILAGTNIFGEPGCVLLRREALQATGGWDDRFPYVLDLHTYCNVLQHGSFVAVDEVLAAFRLNASQWTIALSQQQSEQVVGFHHKVAEETPGLLTKRELLRADTRARGMAIARRLYYLRVGNKLNPPATATSGSFSKDE